MKVVQRFFVGFIIWIGFFFVFLPFWDVVVPQYSLLTQKFISVMGGTLAVILLGLGLLLLGMWSRGRLFSLLQAQNDRSAQRVMSELRTDPRAPVPEFYLYLRAFETTGRLHLPLYLRLRKLSTGLQGFVTNDLESYITAAVRRIAPLIALGHPGETIGAGRIVTEDANWTADIVTLMNRSKAILLVPSSRPGTLWEMDTLKREGLLGKVIFIMPPRTKGDFDTKERWEVSRQTLNNHGLEAPEYHKRGLLFAVGPDGRVSNVEPLLVNMRKSMKRILNSGPPKGGLFKTIVVADKRNRRASFWGWTETLRQLSPYALAAVGLFVGHPNVGFDPSESWATVFSRFTTADKISDYQFPEEILLLTSEKYRALLPSAPEEKLKSELMRRGFVRLKDEDLRDYFIAFGDMLERVNTKTCACIARGEIQSDAMQIAFSYIPNERIDGFLHARTEAVLAGLDEAPFTALDEEAVEKASEQFLANLGSEGRQRFERINRTQGKLSDDDECWKTRAIFGSVAILAEPHAIVWARTLAAGMAEQTAKKPPQYH